MEKIEEESKNDGEYQSTSENQYDFNQVQILQTFPVEESKQGHQVGTDFKL